MIGQKEFVMGKVKYNPEFLRELAGRKNEDGRVPKNKVVAAMNADRSKRDDYEENGKSVTATQLNRWIESEKLPSFMDAIISLSNNLDGISFSDFFLEDDEPMQMVVRKGRRKKEKEQSAEPMFSETVVVRMENKYLKDLADLYARERNLTDLIVQQEKDLRAAREENERLREQLEQAEAADKKKGWTPLPDTGKPYPQIEMPLDMAAEDIGDSNPDK